MNPARYRIYERGESHQIEATPEKPVYKLCGCKTEQEPARERTYT